VRRILLLTTLVLAVLAPAGCGSDDGDEAGGTTAAAGEQSVDLTATEFQFEPADVSLDNAGRVTFTVSNDGQEEHALEVEGNGIEEETETIAPGDSATLTVELEPGEYELYCPIDGHRDQGMEGTLVVGGSSAGAGTSTGRTRTDDDYGYGG
jgi:uncharacterized cupredoxin-like copper-binding protein